MAIRNAASVLKGRILLNLGQYDAAAAAVASVPSSFAWVNEHSDNTVYNSVWSFNNSIGRYFVGNGEGTNGLDFTSNQALVPTCVVNSAACKAAGAPATKAFDPSTPEPLIIQLVWPSRTADVLLMTGTEARLIEAEAQLKAGSAGQALTTLNTLRSGVTGLAPLTSADVPTLFRERAFWLFGTGHRLGDLRRLVRQYNFATDAVYPTGSYWKGGTYGNDVVLPIPQAEENNPNFDRAACVTTQA